MLDASVSARTAHQVRRDLGREEDGPGTSTTPLIPSPAVKTVRVKAVRVKTVRVKTVRV